MSELTPDEIARKCVAAWKVAGPVLEEYRRKKLQSMPEDAGASMLANESSPEEFYSHGLARWQAWMIKWRLKEALKQLSELEKRVT
jgi:hypothetical protein